MNKLKGVSGSWFKVARYLGYTGCVVHCVLEHIAGFVVCIGPSMEPTIFSYNVVITEHISVRRQKINRGDIVISKNPYDPLHYICKRVKAVSGDKVRNGYFSEIVPKGHVWLEGDNKNNSSDSRHYGPVPHGLLRGRVLFRVWPLTEIRSLINYESQNT